VHSTASAPVGLVRHRNQPRRRLTDQQKLDILDEYSRAQFGTKQDVLKKYGLYQATLRAWAKKRDAGMLAITVRPADPAAPDVSRLAHLATRRDELVKQKEQVDAELASASGELLELVLAMAETLAAEAGDQA